MNSDYRLMYLECRSVLVRHYLRSH